MKSSDAWQHKAGRATAFIPPISIGGVAHSFGLLFSCDGSGGERLVGTFKIDAVVPLPGGKKRVVVRRDYQDSSYLLTRGEGDSSQVDYKCLMGGNCALYIEPQTSVSYNNDGSRMGLRQHDRVSAGMCLLFRGRRYNITAATAFAIAPAAVNFSEDTPLPGTARSTIDVAHGVFQRVDWAESFGFDPDDGEVRWSSASSNGTCDRRIFDVGAPDFYPVDATFSTSLPEYHIDQQFQVIRFGFGGLETESVNHLEADVWQTIATAGRRAYSSNVTEPIKLIPATAGAGYQDTSDELIAAAVPVNDAADTPVTILAGSGALEIRDSAGVAGSPFVALLFDATGLPSIKYRTTLDGAVTTDTSHAVSHALPLEIRATWDGATVHLFWREVGAGSWTELGTGYALASNDGGVAAITTWDTDGARWKGVATTLPMVLTHLGGLAGTLSAKFVQGRAARSKQICPKPPTGTALTSVINLTTGVTMSPFVDHSARDIYFEDGDDVWIGAECSGDQIKITTAAPMSVPAGRGLGPQPSSQAHWSENIDGEASESLANNRANWRDALEFLDPRNTFDGEAGEEFDARGDAVFDDAHPPSISYRIAKTGDIPGWTSLDASNYTGYWPDGAIFFKQSWIDSLTIPDGYSLDFLIDGKVYRIRGTVRAQHFNELAKMGAAASSLFVVCGTPGGTGTAMSGECPAQGTQFQPYPTGFTGATTGGGTNYWQADDVAWGTIAEDLHSYSDNLDFYSKDWPFWDKPAPDNLLTYFDAKLRSHFLTADDATIWFPSEGAPGAISILTHDKCVDGEIVYAVGETVAQSGLPLNLPGGYPPPDNFFGGYIPSGTFGAFAVLGRFAAAEFKFTGIGFSAPEFFSRLPDGATVIEAIVRAKFSGLAVSSGSTVLRIEPKTTGGFHVTWEYNRDGALILSGDNEGDNYENPDPPAAPSSGLLTFALVGRERNSKNIELLDGTKVSTPDDRFVGVGAGLAVSTATDDEWSLIDCTGAMQALANRRNSRIGGDTYELVPSVGTQAIETAQDALSGLLQTLMPATSVETLRATTADGVEHWGYEATTAWRYAWFGSLEVENMLVRYRLPNGIVGSFPLQFPRAPFLPLP